MPDPLLGDQWNWYSSYTSLFIVYKGKLYLCGDDGALKEFKSDIDSNIEKADKNWLKLVGP